MRKAEMGEKRRCLACSTAFFDLNRTPIVCPKCAEVFEVIEPIRSSRARSEGFSGGTRWRAPSRGGAATYEAASKSDDETAEEHADAGETDDVEGDDIPESTEVEEIADSLDEIPDSPEVDEIEEMS